MSADAELSARLEMVRAVIMEAGALAVSYFADLHALEVEEKINGQDVVSVADKAVEDLILAEVRRRFPEDGFLGEETGLTEGGSGYLWVVDPIDGTSCFVHGRHDWCVSIALVKHGEPVVGIIFAPVTDELFLGVKGQGASLNGVAINVDGRSGLHQGLLGVGANFRIPKGSIPRFIDNLMEAGGMFIRSGSGALMLVEVACGRMIGYYEPHINAWDCLAALLIIREAGGWTADFPSKAPEIMDGAEVIAAAPQVRAALLEVIAKTKADLASDGVPPSNERG
ncbi:inositol monophosphatase [Acuticoccus sp. M5D2P5]|uniref:inositol monophosphatase family protein n=1 Tax=Acuticoccus kalidii TaxID=2910977 RepID=UPI001F218C0E|nr:inositol monophosphatase [Acuticoccus kalidii]MCF3932739.1 inositol monophosphatase [Acuticoccus kalidii]